MPTIAPVVITGATENSQTTATVGGSLDPGRNGSSQPIIERGVFWGTNQKPDETGNQIVCGSGFGIYSQILSDLTANTTYYVIAYASNIVGTSYGEEVSFTTHSTNSIQDIEGNDYDIVTIGEQVWMKDNLMVTKFNDGTNLLKAIKPESSNLYSSYIELCNGIEFTSKYGRFYNFTLAKSKKICPVGWHVPSDDEWTTLRSSFQSGA